MFERSSKYFLLMISAVTLVTLFSITYGHAAESDRVNDLIRGCSGDPVSQNLASKAGFVDIVYGSASVEGSNLILKLETDEPIPTRASDLVSYSFVLDLDGNEDTGFVANKKPVGVFPGLGVDLWVNYSLYEGEKGVFGFLGSRIHNLESSPALTSYETKKDRRVLKVTVPLSRIETKLKYAYLELNPPWEVKPNKMDWSVFATWAPLSLDDPVSDFSSERHYSETRKGCFNFPLVKIRNGTATGRRNAGDDDNKQPPPPPPPPESPSDEG